MREMRLILTLPLILFALAVTAQSTMDVDRGVQVVRAALPDASCELTGSRTSCEWKSGDILVRVWVDGSSLSAQSRLATGSGALSVDEGMKLLSAWDNILRAYGFSINDHRRCGAMLRKSPQSDCWVRGSQYVLSQWLQADVAPARQSNFDISPSH